MRDILPCGAKRLKVTSQSDGTAISCGAVIDKDLMTTIPLIQMPDQVKLTDGNYVVMILNRDDPSRDNPKNRYWVHLLIANVSVRYLETGSDTTGAFTLTEYAAPTPTANSGPHRYQIFVLKQSTVAGEDMSGQPSYRKGFRAHAFASINKLCNNGSLVGAFEYILRG
ncbi:hypothetical protein LSAT2_002697 [Lamellibrachia satsuma]|nr:hypothetical protein LSAT2_002697 [Lamellibrachia satsuma]